VRASIPLLVALVSVVAASSGAAASRDRIAPSITQVWVRNGDSRYAGDDRLLTTITPNADGFRDRAVVSFRLSEPATVRLAVRQSKPIEKYVFVTTAVLPRGRNTMVWEPGSETEPRTYLVSLRATDRAGNTKYVLPGRPAQRRKAPVVRVQEVDASFQRESYEVGRLAVLRIATDAPELTLQVFRVGLEPRLRLPRGAMAGVPVTTPVLIRGRPRSAPFTVRMSIGDWPSALYFAKLTADDGRVGYAPFVVPPRRLGEHDVAVVLPTKTWQAYNWYDADGNGYGDTWYSGAELPVPLGRPYLDHGVPPYFRYYDSPFLRWVARRPDGADYLSQRDLTNAPTGAALARAYNLIVFPGHHEYVTGREYDLVERYRDLGGNLMFLSANNFFRRIVHRGPNIVRKEPWRHLGRPEAALVGVQYRANDRGQRRGAYVVRDQSSAPWFFAGTKLTPGATFGDYGIEIDAKSAASPPGTTVLAEIPNLFGPGISAQMTYYETAGGAKVFAAGAFTLAGRAFGVPEGQLLANLWARLSLA